MDYNVLQSILQGLALIHLNLSKTRCGGNSTIYSLKSRYNSIHRNNRKEAIWENVWSKDGLHKTNFFCGILAHHKILTVEFFLKWGIEGLSCCTLYKSLEETLEHIFLECPFTNEVWCTVLKELQFNLTLLTNW